MQTSPKEILQAVMSGQRDHAVLASLDVSCQRERLKNPKWMKSCVDEFVGVAKAVNDKQVCLVLFKAPQRAGMPMDVQDKKDKLAQQEPIKESWRWSIGFGFEKSIGDSLGKILRRGPA